MNRGVRCILFLDVSPLPIHPLRRSRAVSSACTRGSAGPGTDSPFSPGSPALTRSPLSGVPCTLLFQWVGALGTEAALPARTGGGGMNAAASKILVELFSLGQYL